MVDIDPIQIEPDFLEDCRPDPVPRWFKALAQAILQRALDDISERKKQRDFRSAGRPEKWPFLGGKRGIYE